jgi:large subunit ribosomal protein L20
MPRATSGLVHHKRQRKVMKAAKGFRGGRSVLYRTAKDAVRKALQHSYKDRKRKKRDMRALWIMRINAAVRMCGLSYSKFIASMNKTGITINRKMLAEIAAKDMNAFKAIIAQLKA